MRVIATWMSSGLLLCSCSLLVEERLGEKRESSESHDTRDASASPDAVDAAARSSSPGSDAGDNPDAPAEQLDARPTERPGSGGGSEADGAVAPAEEAGSTDPSGQAQLCVGAQYACSLLPNGKVTCWGSNSWAQLSLGMPDDRYLAIACGGQHTCAVRRDGSIACAGRNTDNQTLGIPSDQGYVEIAAGALHSCARKQSGRVVCWGALGSSHDEARAPVDSFSAIAAGDGVSCGILTLDRSIKCWGNPADGRTKPPSGSRFKALDLGGALGCAIDEAGELKCWGEASGDAPKLLHARAISVGDSGRGCALLEGGAECWFGGEVKKLGSAYGVVAAGPAAICMLPSDGGQLVCAADLPQDPVEARVPRPYPAP